jgi:hypothetical protein
MASKDANLAATFPNVSLMREYEEILRWQGLFAGKTDLLASIKSSVFFDTTLIPCFLPICLNYLLVNDPFHL